MNTTVYYIRFEVGVFSSKLGPAFGVIGPFESEKEAEGWMDGKDLHLTGAFIERRTAFRFLLK